MARPAPIHWIAGPLGYDGRDDYQIKAVTSIQWLFIGGHASMVRRWALNYNVQGRAFSLLSRGTSRWDQAHAAELAAFYRPIAVLRSDLPKGSIRDALRAMLPATEIAAATAISIRGGRA